jgi:hypothetical protein
MTAPDTHSNPSPSARQITDVEGAGAPRGTLIKRAGILVIAIPAIWLVSQIVYVLMEVLAEMGAPQCANYAGTERDSGYPCVIYHSGSQGNELLWGPHETLAWMLAYSSALAAALILVLARRQKARSTEAWRRYMRQEISLEERDAHGRRIDLGWFLLPAFVVGWTLVIVMHSFAAFLPVLGIAGFGFWAQENLT